VFIVVAPDTRHAWDWVTPDSRWPCLDQWRRRYEERLKNPLVVFAPLIYRIRMPTVLRVKGYRFFFFVADG